MTKTLNIIVKIIVNILATLITVAIFFSIYNLVSLRILHKDYVDVFGYSLFEVVTGSMEPTIKVGDLIIVKRDDNYKKDDIITYRLDDDFITHRITRIDNDFIYTRGDANNSEDNKIVLNQIIGREVLIIKNGGVWRKILLTPKVFISFIVLLILFSLCFSYIPNNKRKKLKSINNSFDNLNYCPLKEVKKNEEKE